MATKATAVAVVAKTDKPRQVGGTISSLTKERVQALLNFIDTDYREGYWGAGEAKDVIAELLSAWLTLRDARMALAGSQRAVDEMRKALGVDSLSVVLQMEHDERG